MSENIYFSKSIKISDIKKKCKQLKIGKQEGLYGGIETPIYPITHKEFPGERVYIIFNEYEDKSLNAKYGENCEDKEFCEIERFYGDEYYHIMLVLSGTFDIEYTSDPRAWSKGEFHRYVLNCQTNNEFAPKFTGENDAFDLKESTFPLLADNEVDFSNSKKLQSEKPMASPNLRDEEYYGKICSTSKIDLFG